MCTAYAKGGVGEDGEWDTIAGVELHGYKEGPEEEDLGGDDDNHALSIPMAIILTTLSGCLRCSRPA